MYTQDRDTTVWVKVYAFDEWMCTHKTETLQTGLKYARLMSGCVHTRQTLQIGLKCTHLMSGCVHTRQKHYNMVRRGYVSLLTRISLLGIILKLDGNSWRSYGLFRALKCLFELICTQLKQSFYRLRQRSKYRKGSKERHLLGQTRICEFSG